MKINLTQNLRPWACLNGGAALTLLAFLAGCGGGGSTGGIGSGIGAGNPTPTPVVTPASTPSPTPVPASASAGEIVFRSSRDGRLSRVNLDGSNLTSIPTTGEREPGYPAWFPGRQEFVYADTSASRGGVVSSIRRVNRDGSNDRIIIAPDVARFSRDLEVSPDGSRISFSRGGSGDEVFVANADGTNPVRLTQGFLASWSPDGQRLVFSKISEDFQSDIYVINADGSNERRLTTTSDMGEASPQFSPDGRRIVYTSGQLNRGQGEADPPDIYVMNADGSNPTRLTTNAGAFNGNSEPEWTPDGSRIVFLCGRGSDGAELSIMNADGSNQRPLSSTPIYAANYDLR